MVDRLDVSGLSPDGTEGQVPKIVGGKVTWGGGKFTTLADVDATNPPADGDTYVWDGAIGKFVPAGNERIIVLNAGVTTLPDGAPAKALVVRRLA